MFYRLIAGTINHYEAEEGWENVHLDITNDGIWHPGLEMFVQPEFCLDIAETSFRPGTFDEVRLHHVLEHMGRDRGLMALREIHRILVPDGQLDIEVPDMGRIVDAWHSKQHTEQDLQQWIYGEDLGHAADFHRYGWSEEALYEALEPWFEIIEKPDTGLAVRFVCRRKDVPVAE